MATAISPALGPLIGGKLQVWFGWQACFVLLAALGVAVLATAMARLKESLPRNDPGAAGSARLLLSYVALLGNGVYRGYAVLIASFFGGLFAFATGLPFIFIDLAGMSPDVFGGVFVLVVIGYLAGSLVVSRVADRVATERLVAGGTAIQFAAAAALLVLMMLGHLSVASIMLPIMVFMFGFAVALPGAQAAAMAPFPMMAGAASALLGFVQMAMAALAAAGVAVLYDGTAVPMAMVLFAMTAIAAVACSVVWRNGTAR
jgi:DHA1 family bicyclomycin/chloramphenicol resistance-like MFS transporter